MPCDEVREISINLPNLDESLMQETLESLGIANRVAYLNGKLTTRSSLSSSTIEKIKVAYSHKVVIKVAKKRGWKISKISETEYELER